jgi:hypothetical protein
LNQKKNSKTKKQPEKSISEKVNHHKGERNALKKRVKNLEKRLLDFETRLNKYIAKEPVDNWGGYNKKKKKQKEQESFREKFLKEHHPKNKEEE